MAFPTTSPPSFSSAWQISLQNSQNTSGLILGLGTAYGVSQIDGIGAPVIETSDGSRPRDQGDLVGLDFLAGRDMVLTGDVVSDGTSLQHAIEQLALVTTPILGYGGVEYPMWINMPNLVSAGTNTPMASLVRCRKRDIPFDLGFSVGYATFALQMSSTDPRFYGAPITNTQINTGGLSSIAVSVTNGGNYETRPVVTVTGPIASGFTIIASGASTGSLTVNKALAAGDTLVVDTDLHTAQFTHSGVTTNARAALGTSPTWWTTNPGTTSIALAGSSLTTATSIAANYSPAWIF